MSDAAPWTPETSIARNRGLSRGRFSHWHRKIQESLILQTLGFTDSSS
jgi:hypothetical protein